MVNRSENAKAFRIKSKNTTSKYRGVGWHRKTKKWRAKINPNGVCKDLGIFSSEIDAAKAYDKAAIELNFLPEALNFNKSG